jgi:hypothetical protein
MLLLHASWICDKEVCMGETQAGQATGRASAVQRAGDVEASLGLRVAQLQVLSRTLANVAHDVQNHLAAINESAGWMGDLLELKNRQRFGWIGRFFKRGNRDRLDVRPFSSALNAIQKQVVQGSTSNQRLSGFAHRLEATRSVFSGNKALEEIRDALLREAADKGIHVEMKLANGAPMIETEPPGFQLAVFCGVEQVMEGLESGDRLVLETEVAEGRFHVRFTSEGPGESGSLLSEEPDGQDFSRAIVEELGGQIWEQPGDGNHITTLVFPLARAET